MYTGISLKAATAASDIHAEPVAVSRAILDGKNSFDTVVAVQFENKLDNIGMQEPDQAAEATKIVSPCGGCRELLAKQAPDISIIVPDSTGTSIKNLDELLPY